MDLFAPLPDWGDPRLADAAWWEAHAVRMDRIGAHLAAHPDEANRRAADAWLRAWWVWMNSTGKAPAGAAHTEHLWWRLLAIYIGLTHHPLQRIAQMAEYAIGATLSGRRDLDREPSAPTTAAEVAVCNAAGDVVRRYLLQDQGVSPAGLDAQSVRPFAAAVLPPKLLDLDERTWVVLAERIAHLEIDWPPDDENLINYGNPQIPRAPKMEPDPWSAAALLAGGVNPAWVAWLTKESEGEASVPEEQAMRPAARMGPASMSMLHALLLRPDWPSDAIAALSPGLNEENLGPWLLQALQRQHVPPTPWITNAMARWDRRPLDTLGLTDLAEALEASTQMVDLCIPPAPETEAKSPWTAAHPVLTPTLLALCARGDTVADRLRADRARLEQEAQGRAGSGGEEERRILENWTSATHQLIAGVALAGGPLPRDLERRGLLAPEGELRRIVAHHIAVSRAAGRDGARAQARTQ